MTMTASRRTLAISACLLGFLLIAVCLRSWVFVWFAHSHFDSDQAIFGIMGKDLIAGRAIPLFTYGRGYMLAVSVWLSGPLFALFGPSVTTLKLPMLAMNLAVVVMLWIGMRREGLSPWGSALAALPFALPGVVTSSRLLEHAGGNIEPFPFVLAGFFLRRHPIGLGLLMGVAYLNREFALIGFLALLVMDVLEGRLVVRLKQRALTAAVILAVVFGLRAIAKRYTSFDGTGPGFGGEGWSDVAAFFKLQLPILLGAAPRHVMDYNITSSLTLGHAFIYYAGACLLILACLGARTLKRFELGNFSTYLILVGGGQAAAFMLFSGTPYDLTLVRYVLLVMLAFSGLVAYAWRTTRMRILTAALVLAVTSANVWDSSLLAQEYLGSPPIHENQRLAAALEERQIKYAVADYWVAYDVSWLTNERVTVSARSDMRVPRYAKLLEKNKADVVNVSDSPCRRGEQVLRWYLCRNKRAHPKEARQATSDDQSSAALDKARGL
jgi:hypothetical protein